MNDLPDPTVHPAPTRRGLLKSLAALGALGVTGGASTAATLGMPGGPRRALEVTAIVPARSPSPDLAGQFTQGLTDALRGQAVRVRTRTTGPLPREAAAAATAARTQGCDLLIALGDGLGPVIAEALQDRPVPLLLAEFGAHLPGTHVAPPLTATLSLHACEAEWAMGRHLARRHATHAAGLHLVISDLEAGYDLPYAFSSGFSAGGGLLTGTTVFSSRRPDVAAALAEVHASGARAAHVIASGQGGDLLQALRGAGLQVSKGGLTAPDLPGVPSALAAPAASGGLPPAALLGFDAGRWVRAALAGLPAQAAGTVPALTLHSALLHSSPTGGRRTLQPDAQGTARSAVLLRQAGQPDAALDRPPAGLVSFQRPGGLRSGWLYTYLHA